MPDEVQSESPVPRTCGVRFSLSDGCVIGLCGALTAVLWGSNRQVALLFPVVLGHFFLFCNVFRIRRGYELLWAGLFLVNAGAWHIFSDFGWSKVLAAQTPLTVAFIILEMRSARYHGVGCRWINARHIDAWQKGQLEEAEPPNTAPPVR